MLIPTIHLNGTSRGELVEQNLESFRAIGLAIEALYKAAPNGRDYYTQGPGAIHQALSEHADRVRRLENVRQEILTIAEAITA